MNIKKNYIRVNFNKYLHRNPSYNEIMIFFKMFITKGEKVVLDNILKISNSEFKRIKEKRTNTLKYEKNYRKFIFRNFR